MKGWEGWIGIDRVIYLSESLVVEAVWVFFLFGVGILHSIWKATQLVQGTPREAASQRTFLLFNKACQSSDLSARDRLEALALSSSACAWGAGLTGGVHREAISSSGSGPRLSGALGSLVQGMSVEGGIDVRMASLF